MVAGAPIGSAAQDSTDKRTVHAVRLQEPLRVDGALDEAVYTTVTPATDFVQTEPRAGAVSTERTEVWITFDSENVYVSMRASESQPERMVINECMRRPDRCSRRPARRSSPSAAPSR